MFCRIPAPLTTLPIAGFSPLEGGMIINDPLPITHQVRTQPIIGKKENGPSATFMGNASTEAYVKGEIAHVWAQSGVAIQWELAGRVHRRPHLQRFTWSSKSDPQGTDELQVMALPSHRRSAVVVAAA